MINLSILENLIQNAKSQPHSENAVDEHFDQIVLFIEQEKTKEAAGLIEKVFAKNVPDIRLIVYYFYAHFTEHGIKSFVKTLPLAKSLIHNHIDILTPKNRIDKHVQSSLNWFFSHLLQRFKYYEKLQSSGKIHPLWKKSFSETSLDELDQLTEISKEFNQFFLENWPLSPTRDRILHLTKKIEDIRKIVAESQKPILEEIEEAKVEEDLNKDPVMNLEACEVELKADEQLEKDSSLASDEVKEDVHEPVFKGSASDETTCVDGNETSSCIQTLENANGEEFHDQSENQNQNTSSFSILCKVDKETIGEPLQLFIKSLDNLSRKLKIFEVLIEKDDYLKAAVVANDIDHLIENFDPLSYFPKLFAKYFSTFAKHVTALTEQYEKRDSLQVKALVKLYRTDLEMFLDW